MTDDLAARRILKQTPLPSPMSQADLTFDERRKGFRSTQTLHLARHSRARLWELQHHCGLSTADDGSLLYLSFASKKLVRFPTLKGEMVER